MKYKFFEPYQGRNVVPGQSVQVYRNLKYKNEPVYSIRSVNTGLVLGHATTLLLSRCVFVVSQAGRKRVLREKRKNVHAWVEGCFGIIHAGDDKIFNDGVKVTYNPYKDIAFKYGEDVNGYERQHYIPMANVVWIDETGVYASGL